MTQRWERPFGIALLSLFYLAGAIFTVVLWVWGASVFGDPRFTQRMAAFDAPGVQRNIAYGITTVLGLAPAVGLWIGARWGWYLGSFYKALGIVRSFVNFYLVREYLNSLKAQGFQISPAGYITSYGIPTFILLMVAVIYWYYFRANVRQFFGISHTRKWPVVAIQLFLAVDVMLALVAWSKYSL